MCIVVFHRVANVGICQDIFSIAQVLLQFNKCHFNALAFRVVVV